MEEQKKILKNYSDGVQRLDFLLEGLSEDQLNLVRQEGKWSIRQIVHHIADAEEIWALAIKTALGNTGCTFDLSWYKDNNLCAEPKRFDLAGILGFQEVHLNIHLEQILETKRVHHI